jgi:outer membrane protein TolC
MYRLSLILVTTIVGVACAASAEEAATPDAGIQSNTPGLADAAAKTTVPRVLDLRTIERLTLEQNPSLRAAQHRIEQAHQRVRQARSFYWPRVDVGADASKTWLSDNDVDALRDAAYSSRTAGFRAQLQSAAINAILGNPTPPVGDLIQSGVQSGIAGHIAAGNVPDETEAYTASLIASWTLFDGFAREHSLAASRFAEQESEAAYREAQRLLLSFAAISYYQAQLAEEVIAIAQADEAFNERQLEEARSRQVAGAGSLSDVLNFEVRLNSTHNARISAERDLQLALIALAEVLGMAEEGVPDNVQLAPMGDEEPADLVAPGAEEYISMAQAYRPDLQQLGHAVDRSDAIVKVERGVYYPQVATRLSRNAFRTNNAGFDGDDFDTQVGINVSYNLFAGGLNRARVAEAKAVRSETEWTLRNAEVMAAADVRQAVTEVTTAQKLLELEKANAANTLRNRDLVSKGYDVGQESLVRLNEAQRDLNQAQARLATARVSLRLAWYGLRTASGLTVALPDEVDAE